MEKQEVLNQMERVVEFRKSLPNELKGMLIACEIGLYGMPKFHFRESAFLVLFTEFKIIGYNGPNITLDASGENYEAICLCPIHTFIEKFGADRLPKNV